MPATNRPREAGDVALQRVVAGERAGDDDAEHREPEELVGRRTSATVSPSVGVKIATQNMPIIVPSTETRRVEMPMARPAMPWRASGEAVEASSRRWPACPGC
jgi:hypothetical protein